jgi:LysM repeat protein
MNTYTVQPGDTLQSIAKSKLGDESMAQYLASINSIPGQPGFTGQWVYTIQPGQKIKIDVAGVTGKKAKAWPWIIGIAAISTAIYYRKEIANLF